MSSSSSVRPESARKRPRVDDDRAAVAVAVAVARRAETDAPRRTPTSDGAELSSVDLPALLRADALLNRHAFATRRSRRSSESSSRRCSVPLRRLRGMLRRAGAVGVEEREETTEALLRLGRADGTYRLVSDDSDALEFALPRASEATRGDALRAAWRACGGAPGALPPSEWWEAERRRRRRTEEEEWTGRPVGGQGANATTSESSKTTLAERVRARALRSDARAATRRPESSSPPRRSATANNNTSAHLLRLADALRFHVARRGRPRSSSSSVSASATIVVPLRELAEELRGVANERRDETARSLRALAAAVPEWLTVETARGAHRAVVVARIRRDVDPPRARLGGRVMVHRAVNEPPNVAEPTTAAPTKDDQGTSHRPSPPRDDDDDDPSREPIRTPPRDDDRDVRGTTTDDDPVVATPRAPAGRDDLATPTKTTRDESERAERLRDDHVRPPRSVPSPRRRGRKRRVDFDRGTDDEGATKRGRGNDRPPPPPPPPSSSLRVNENLVFCDADARGRRCTFRMAPTHKHGDDASPRGLRTLFTRLNAGRRI